MTTNQTGDTEVLTTHECWELLRESVVGRLAVTVAGSPDIFPVNPIVDHGTIVFRTSAGTKFAATKGNEVAFEVDGYDAGTAQAWSVVAKGRAHEILEVEEPSGHCACPCTPGNPAGSPALCASSPRASPVAGSSSTAGSGPTRATGTPTASRTTGPRLPNASRPTTRSR